MYRILFETSSGCCSMSAGLFSSSLGVPRCLDPDGPGAGLGPSKTSGEWYPHDIHMISMISIWYQWYPYYINDIHMISNIQSGWLACLWVARFELLIYDIFYTCTVNKRGSRSWSTHRRWPWCFEVCFTTWGPFPINIRPSTQRCGLGWGGDVNVPCTCTHGLCYAGVSAAEAARFILPLLIKSGRVILGLKKLKGKGKGAGGQVGQ